MRERESVRARESVRERESDATGWQRPIGCFRSFSANEPLIIGLFCRK